MRVQKTFEFVEFLDKTWNIDVELVYDIEEERIDTNRSTETQLIPTLRKLHIEDHYFVRDTEIFQ